MIKVYRASSMHFQKMKISRRNQILPYLAKSTQIGQADISNGEDRILNTMHSLRTIHEIENDIFQMIVS